MAVTVKALVISVAIALSLYLALFFAEVGFVSKADPASKSPKLLEECPSPKLLEECPSPKLLEECPSTELLELDPPVKPAPSWLINDPAYFYERSFDGSMKDVRENPAEIALFEDFIVNFKYDDATDYEAVDALEQFFWGQKEGLCIELGAVDGGEATHSQTYDYEKKFGWRRILVEGNPQQRSKLLDTSPNSFVASTAVCKDTTKLHYLNRGLVSGIAEFMTDDFLKNFYPPFYKSMVPPGNLSSVDWDSDITAIMSDLSSEVIDCVPMGTILRQAKASHVNYFILDVEGAEYQVLEAIDWRRVKFDVVCIEIDPYYRPVGNTDKVVRFMASKGYLNYSGLIGRNIWFVRNDFIPKKRPSNALPDDDKKKYREKDICFRRACPRPW